MEKNNKTVFFHFLVQRSGLSQKKASTLAMIYNIAVMAGWHPPKNIETVGELAQSITDYFRIYLDDYTVQKLEGYMPTDCDTLIDVDPNFVEEVYQIVCDSSIPSVLLAIRETPD